MFDASKVVGFDWDEGNARKSKEKHNVSQFEAEQVFFNDPLLVVPDQRQDYSELRHHALGKTDLDRLLHLTFTLRAENALIRVISARDMYKKERAVYEQA